VPENGGDKTVSVGVTFDSPLTVTTSQNNALDLEFDLGHPAFIVGHVPPGAGMDSLGGEFQRPGAPIRSVTSPGWCCVHLYAT